MMMKNKWFTYVQYGIYILFLAGLIILNTGLLTDISGNNIIRNCFILGCTIVFTLVIILAAFFVKMIAGKIGKTGCKIAYIIILSIVAAASLGIRAYYLLNYTSLFNNNMYPVYIDVICCVLAVARLVLIYFVGYVSAGKQAGLAALFFEGFYYGEVINEFVLDYRNIAAIVILLIVLLYCCYYKICQQENNRCVARIILTSAILVIILSFVFLSIYYEYSLMLPLIISLCVIISMLFISWKNALILIIGIPVLCMYAYCCVAVSGYGNQRQLNAEIEHRVDGIEQYISGSENITSYITDKINDNTDYKESTSFVINEPVHLVLSVNYMQINNMMFIYMSLISVIYMLFKKKNAMAMYMLYSAGAYLWDSNIIICSIFTISIFYQQLYERRKCMTTDNCEISDEDINEDIDIDIFIDNSESAISAEAETDNVETEDSDADITESEDENVINEHEENRVYEPVEETDEISNLDKFIIPDPDLIETDEVSLEYIEDSAEQLAEEPLTESTEEKSTEEFTKEIMKEATGQSTEDSGTAGYNDTVIEDAISKLPVPKPVINYDEESGNVRIKKASSFDSNFDKDKWNNRKNRRKR